MSPPLKPEECYMTDITNHKIIQSLSLPFLTAQDGKPGGGSVEHSTARLSFYATSPTAGLADTFLYPTAICTTFVLYIS